MALMKEKVDERGIVTNYHKIGGVSLRDGNLYFDIESYPSVEYRKTARPASVSHHYFNLTVEEEESMGIRQLCYAKLKAEADWADAQDC